MADATRADLDAAKEAWSGDSDEDIREFFTELIAKIDVNLLGSDDDGEEAAQYFYLRAIERAHDFAVKQPCECTFTPEGEPDEVCERCRVIGCSWDSHRNGAGCRRVVTTSEQIALLNKINQIAIHTEPGQLSWKLTRDQLNVLAWPYNNREFFSRTRPYVHGGPVEVVATEAESSLA